MHIIIGLGNPGREYEHTRHNVGFDVVEVIAQRQGISMNRLDLHGQIGEGGFGAGKLVLVRPQTYMNLSGQCVQEVLSWYKPEPDHVLLIYDDIDLPLGKLRMRRSGSAGTHNGMRSVIRLTGREDLPRLRVGIGTKPPQWDLADFVLSGYATPQERAVQFDAFLRAAEVADIWRRQGMDRAIQAANTANAAVKEEP